MRSEQNIATLMMASDFYNTASKTLSDLPDNQLGIVCVKDASGTLDPNDLFTETGESVAEGDEFKLAVKRADGNIKWSDTITKDGIFSLKYESHSDPTEQIDYIGYDAENDAGSLEVINDNSYYASVTFFGSTKHDFAMQNKLPAIYRSEKSGNTGYSVAAGIANVFRNNMKYYRDNYRPIVATVVTDDSGTALSGTTGDITVKKGTKGISAGSDIDGEMSVGDLFRNSNDVTGDVYEIVEMDTSNDIAVLDRPYEGEDETLTASDCDYIDQGDISSAEFGVKIEGQTPDAIPGYVNFEPVRFNTGIFDMGTTNLSKSAQDASRGIGAYQYIDQLNSQLKQNEGIIYRATPELELPRADYVSASDSNADGFDMASIGVRKKSANPLGDFTYSMIQVYIALDTDGSNNSDLAAALGGEV